jgi:hypothetical protein
MAKTLISTPYDGASYGNIHGSVSEVTITSGIDDTYSVYEFHIVIHPETDNKILKWQANQATGGSNTSGYNQNITSTGIRAYHYESGTDSGVGYDTSIDQQNSDQALEWVVDNIGAENHENMAAILTLYDPSSTTFVKHFTVESSTHMSGDGNKHELHAGYINATEAIDEIKFVMSDGDIQDGYIKMFGVT